MLPHAKEVFLCHSSLDGEFANRIATLLRRHNVPVWYGPTNIRGGQHWHDEVGEALRRCDWFVILVSPNSIRSAWVKRELTFALKQRRYNDTIVPVILQLCDYEHFYWTLSSYQVVDFTEDFDAGCRALLRIWGINYQPIDPTA